jgi:uncharacterized protein YjbI with pentapeptide repeats/transcriptional regulator with XRE-family HTH domain
MGRSFRVSEEGLKRAKEAFHLTGWTQEYLAGSVACKRQTVAKFFAGGDVEKRFFEAICRELNLKVAEIADFESEEEQLNTSVSVNGNRGQNLVTLTQKLTESDEEKFSFCILGTASKVDIPKLKAIVAHLQKITGDTSIEIVDIEKGSIRLILEGSQESLEQIEGLFKSGQLTEVQGIPVQDVQFVTPQIPEPDEDIQTIDRKRLAFIIASSASSEEIQELKTAFTETLDNDKEIEADDKARLVQEIITRRAKDRDLSRAKLIGADLSGAILSDANLSGVDLSDAYLSRVDLRGADLSGAILSDANLSGVDLSGAILSGAILRDTDLRGTHLSRADLSGAILSLAILSDTNLIGANLIGADLSRADLSGANLSGAILSGANLSGANLIVADLSRANLSGADLSDTNLIGANLSGADLSGANLIGADLSRADLSGAVVEKARFGANVGLTEKMKLDLKRRGAIFEDSPGERSGVLSGR